MIRILALIILNAVFAIVAYVVIASNPDDASLKWTLLAGIVFAGSWVNYILYKVTAPGFWQS